MTPRDSVSLSIGSLLGVSGGDVPKERYQDPSLQQTKRGVWFIRPWVDVVVEGRIDRQKKTIAIGKMGKREAETKAREIMRTINRADYMITSQIQFGRFLEEYQAMHVEKLAASTRDKYANHLKNHIRPAFENMRLGDVQPLLVQKWLDTKALSWATKTDIRNILSSIFTKAIEWGRWKDANPIEHVHAGRKKLVREQRKLTDDETRRLLAALQEDVRLLCCVCLFTTLRISEALGLQEKHLDFARGLILVRQRFYRGDLSQETKTSRSRRDVPMGYLEADLQAMCEGNPERFVFQIKTRPEWGRRESICRDDRDLNQHFLRPAAKLVGCYWAGFGFHALRREAVTAFNASLGVTRTMRMAGHAKADMSAHYTLADHQAEDNAIRSRQETIMGRSDSKLQ